MHYISKRIIESIDNGGKVLIFGCGGLATMSSHFAAELVCKFKKERKALPAIALTTDPAIITAIANDYGFEYVFSRQIEAIGKVGDIAIGMSTSGKSQSIINGLRTARDMGLIAVDFPRDGQDTANTQEIQLILMHIICQEVEDYYATT